MYSQWKEPPYPVDQLMAVLKLSTRYLMTDARDWSIRGLSHTSLEPCTKLELAQQYAIEEWIEPAFRALLKKPITDLTINDAQKIGLQKLLALAQTLEIIHQIRTTIAYSGPQNFVIEAS